MKEWVEMSSQIGWLVLSSLPALSGHPGFQSHLRLHWFLQSAPSQFTLAQLSTTPHHGTATAPSSSQSQALVAAL